MTEDKNLNDVVKMLEKIQTGLNDLKSDVKKLSKELKSCDKAIDDCDARVKRSNDDVIQHLRRLDIKLNTLSNRRN